MAQVLTHELGSQVFVFGRNGFQNFAVILCRLLCRMRALVHQRDKRAARNQFVQQLREHIVAHQLGHADMESAL